MNFSTTNYFQATVPKHFYVTNFINQINWFSYLCTYIIKYDSYYLIVGIHTKYCSIFTPQRIPWNKRKDVKIHWQHYNNIAPILTKAKPE